MPIEARYHEQVRLLVSLLPFLNDEPCFALKGGTAINLFVQPLPRLSVDIDLAYLPLEPREEALRRCREALQRLAETFSARLPGVRQAAVWSVLPVCHDFAHGHWQSPCPTHGTETWP